MNFKRFVSIVISASLTGLGLLVSCGKKKDSGSQSATTSQESLVPIVSQKSPIEFTSENQLTLNAVQTLKVEMNPLLQRVKIDSQGDIYNLRSSDNSIVVYDSGMRLKYRIGHVGQGPGELQDPRDFAISPSGLVYVADTGNQRVQIFDSAGKFVSGFQVDYAPRAIMVNSRDEVFLNGARYKEHIIDVYSPHGKLLRSFGQPRKIDFRTLTNEDLPGEYTKQLAGILNEGILDLDQDDNVYFAFRSAPLLRKYDRFGKLLFEIETRNAELDRKLPEVIEGLKEKIKQRRIGYKGVIICLSVDHLTGTIWLRQTASPIFVYNREGKKLAEVRLVDAEGKPSGSVDFAVRGNRVVDIGFLTKGINVFNKPSFKGEQ